MSLQKYVLKFRENLIKDSKLPLENFKEHNALVKKNNAIVDVVCKNNLKNDFFKTLFCDSDLFVRLGAAIYSEIYEYDLKRSLEEFTSFVTIADSLSLDKNTQAGQYKFDIEEYAIKRIKQKLAISQNQ